MTGLRELRETMLSCTLKHSAVDLRGTSEHTKCRETMRERGAGRVASHRTPTHTGNYCGVTQVQHTHTHTHTHTQTCAHAHINSND